LISFSLSLFHPICSLLGSSSYHPQQQQQQRGRSSRYPDREKDRLDRLDRGERDRIHMRERDMMSYDEDLMNDRHYGGGGSSGMRDRDRGMRGGGIDDGGGSGSEYPMHRDERRAIMERDMRDRDSRMDARDRREHYIGSNSRHLMNNSYDSDNVDLIRDKEKERYGHRRDEYNYSPQHRGNRNSNRRVLNLNAM
jgi:hypothetical protein